MNTILNTPLQVGNTQFANRMVIQPMEGCDGTADGNISEWTRRRYLRFARAGVALIWFEATAVCPEGRANPRQLWLTESNVDDYRALLDEMRRVAIAEHGFAPQIYMQMTHSGRQSRPVDVPRPVYAWDNPYLESVRPLPSQAVYADTAYLAELPKQFVHAALLAQQAGFDGVDVKCCHGYLFNELMSAYGRQDAYGGQSLDNRARLYLDTYRAVSEAVGDTMRVTSRFGVYDGFEYPYGFGVNAAGQEDLSEAFRVIESLRGMGLDMLNVTIGNPYVNPHVNRPYRGAESPESPQVGIARVRRITAQIQRRFPDLAVIMSAMTCNGADSMQEAEACIESEQCKMVGYGRMAFAYPQFFVDYLATGQIDPKKVCIACGNCSKMMRAGGIAGCPVRDTQAYLPLWKELFPTKQK